MAALAMVCRAALFSISAACADAPAATAEQTRPASPRLTCLSPADTREEVKGHKLLEPFAALKSAATQRKAEALSVRLCRMGDEFFYEITLLHRDGRLVHVQMDADTGKLIARPSRGQREAAPREPHEPAPRDQQEGAPREARDPASKAAAPK